MTRIPYLVSLPLTFAGLGFLLASAESMDLADSLSGGLWLAIFGLAVTMAGGLAMAARMGR